VIHPYVLAAAPVLFFYSVNIHHYDFPALVRPLVIVTAMMLIHYCPVKSRIESAG